MRSSSENAVDPKVWLTFPGVDMIMSGESARIERRTASETRCVRLIDRTSFAQKADREAKDLCTCSASSLVGTSTRAEMALGAEEACDRFRNVVDES